MALIEVFHVVASELPLDPNGGIIRQGMLVSLDANGNVVLSDGDQANAADSPEAIGIAGDSRSTGTTSYTPESGSALSRDPVGTGTGALVTGSFATTAGPTRFTQNRVSDNYNEVLASSKMTVYHSGGEFWTDQYELVDDGGAVCQYIPGSRLYSSGAGEAAGAGETFGGSGRFTDLVSTTTQIVGRTLTAPTAYPSGVPGTDTGFTQLPEGGNSLTWGNFLHVKLEI